MRSVFKEYSERQQILINYIPPGRSSDYDDGSEAIRISKKQLSLVNNHPLLQRQDRIYIFVTVVDGRLRIVPSVIGYDGPSAIFKNKFYHPARIIKLGRDLLKSIKDVASFVASSNV